jgi:hypothetical protein
MMSNDTIFAAVFTDDDGHIFACNDLNQYECQMYSNSMTNTKLTVTTALRSLIDPSAVMV